jgi:predicted nucleotidyltransferase
MRKLIKKLKEVFDELKDEYEIEYAILFGSYATGNTIDESDLDIAIKLEKMPKSFRKKLNIIGDVALKIEEAVGIETDVVIVNDVDAGLRFEIFSKGKTIMVEDKDSLIEDKVKTMREYHDFSIWAKPLYDELIRRVMNGR